MRGGGVGGGRGAFDSIWLSTSPLSNSTLTSRRVGCVLFSLCPDDYGQVQSDPTAMVLVC